MEQLTYVGAGHIEWREVPEPQLQGDREALVRPIAVTTCDLDFAIVRGLVPFPAPFALGHESVGEVITIGAAVATVQPGDRAAVPFQISCGACSFCSRGLTANCVSVPRTSMYGIGVAGGNWGGMLSDVIRVPFADHMLVKLPAGIPPAAAASAGDNIADGWRGVAPQLLQRPGAAVLILGGAGGGSVGLYATQVALALGAERVEFYDRDESRVRIARKIGAHAHLVDTWPQRLGSYPITVESCQDPEGLACALRSTEPGGYCTITSMYFGGLTSIPLTEMDMKGVTLSTGRVHSRAVLPAVLELIETKRIAPELITTATASWRDAADALLQYTTKLVVVRER
ncbi:MAG TPA: alcohol dehydrogenase catalytic domain-containing protein [Myxococcaceae bacterium]|nr:alcohol dehydrogenase catalytic domain-containing protein [Myxococcaceae bacterium]